MNGDSERQQWIPLDELELSNHGIIEFQTLPIFDTNQKDEQRFRKTTMNPFGRIIAFWSLKKLNFKP